MDGLISLFSFGNFFNHVDSFASEAFLFVTSGGIPAAKSTNGKNRNQDRAADEALESEPEDIEVQNGEGEEG